MTGGVVIATEDDKDNGRIFLCHNMGQKTSSMTIAHDQGDNRCATTMAAPTTSPAADADNVKDEVTRETKEDDGDEKNLGTNKVRHVGATPAAPTTPILVTREVDQGLQPVARCNDVYQDRAATQRQQQRGSPIPTAPSFSTFCMTLK